MASDTADTSQADDGEAMPVVIFKESHVSTAAEDGGGGGGGGGGAGGDDDNDKDAPEVSQMILGGNQASTADLSLEGSAETHGPTKVGKRRRSLGDGSEPDRSEATHSQPGHSAKKIKLAEGQGGAEQDAPSPRTIRSSPLSLDRSLLPAEIWHHVFTFCPPKSLGCLLAACKVFNVYLDPISRLHCEAPSATPGALGSLEPNAIWQASRRLFWPQMPAPLRSKTELEMWRLACSPRCQDCRRLHVRGPASSPDPHHPGPGTEGVVAIWAFGSRMCAACLLKTSDKVRGLLLQTKARDGLTLPIGAGFTNIPVYPLRHYPRAAVYLSHSRP
jgi:hypothetical protein